MEVYHNMVRTNTSADIATPSCAGDGTQRRRARDRTAKKVDILKPLAVVRPLTNNPLRPSGPVRRTCGVIKLPVTYVRMPSPSEEEGKERANSPDDSAKDPENPKSNLNSDSVTTVTPVSVAVPALWENRLLGVKACDYETGHDIIPPPKGTNGTSNDAKPKTGNTNRVPALKSPPPLTGATTVASLLTQQLQQSLKAAVSLSSPSGAVIPSLLSHTGRVSPSLKNGQSKESHGVLVALGNKNTSTIGTGSIVRVENKQVIENLSRMVTETDLRLQEEKVRHLRQQLLAAEKC